MLIQVRMVKTIKVMDRLCPTFFYLGLPPHITSVTHQPLQSSAAVFAFCCCPALRKSITIVSGIILNFQYKYVL